MKEKLNIAVSGPEVVIRHGDAPKVVDPVKHSVFGTITAPAEYLRTKHLLIPFTQECLHQMVVTVNRDARLISFQGDPSNPLTFEVNGRLNVSKDYEILGLNSGKEYSPADLAKLLKQNRHLFSSREELMVVISDLTSFKAEVNQQVTTANDGRGNKTNVVEQAVRTNVPLSFLVNIPLFKGGPKQKLKVEVELDVRGSSVSCTLHSPDALETMNNTSDAIIDEQLKAFVDAGITVLEV